MTNNKPILVLLSLISLVLFLSFDVSAQESPPSEYKFRLVLVSVIDGDTLEGDVLLPFGVCLQDQRIRVLGVDAWEVKGPETLKGNLAKDYAVSVVNSGTVWISPTGKRERDNFGRILSYVYIEKDGKWRDLSKELIENKHGIEAKE